MQPYPHIYTVFSTGNPGGVVRVSANLVPTIETAPPTEFDGPGDKWSPESLLCAAIADCFILTFRSVARASKLEWLRLDCRVEGKLERAPDGVQFTHFSTYAALKVSPSVDVERAKLLLEKAEHGCLVSNSLRATRSLDATVVIEPDGPGAPPT